VSFTVTARVAARRIAFQHISLLNALDQGMSLIAAGMVDVLIADADGLARSPLDLYQHMFGTREGALPLDTQLEAVAIAA
jgi:hypothetical protein